MSFIFKSFNVIFGAYTVISITFLVKLKMGVSKINSILIFHTVFTL